MSVKIRLRRMGKKKQPHYRIVVADSRSPRDGRFVENLGYYNPITHPAQLKVDLERVDYWLGEGAIASRTVGNLLSRARAGGDEKVALVADGEAAPATDSVEAAETAEAAEPAEAAGIAEATETTEAAESAETTETSEAAEASGSESGASGEPAGDGAGEADESVGADAAAEAAAAADPSADESEEAGDSAEDSTDDSDPGAADSPEPAADEDTAE